MGGNGKHQSIAIDGGGTICRLAFVDGDTTVSVETGAANVSTDFSGALTEIFDGIDQLAARVDNGVDLAALPAFVGLAGVTGPEIADKLRDALPFKTLRVEDDRPAALRGALGQRDGVLAHCGTGSFFGAQLNGKMRFSGGWGATLGDEASAQWLGRRALGLTLEAADGRRAMTPMADRLIRDFGDPAGIVRFAAGANPATLGKLAPIVTDFAAKGDTLAESILQAGADEIARSLPLIGWRADLPICLTGGVGPQFKSYLPDRMQIAVVAPAGTPLEGAIALAQDLAKATACA